jgi:photosystem II stability/assembly factor-like uncharacterized protein
MVEDVQVRARARRAFLLIGVAVVALIGGASVYLWPSLHPSAPAAIATPRPQPALAGMTWTSAQNGWVVLVDSGLSRSTLYRTTDGGRHWRPVRSSRGLLEASFVDSRHGVLTVRDRSSGTATGPPIYRTEDGGAHWTRMPVPGSVRGLPQFVDRNHGWLTTGADPQLYVQGVRNSFPLLPQDFGLWRTDDGGRHWRLLVQTDSSNAVSHGVREQDAKLWLSFTDARSGWLGALEANGSLTLYATRDSGESWVPVTLPPPDGAWRVNVPVIGSLKISPDGRGTLVVLSAPNQSIPPPSPIHTTVWSTEDGGQTWSDPTELPATSTAFPYLADGSTSWRAAGDEAWVSRDSGRSWTRAGTLPGQWTVNYLVAINAQVAWAVVIEEVGVTPVHWRLYVTGDGGRDWRQLPVPTAL